MEIQIWQQIKQKAQALGFNMIGFIPARPARRLAAYLRWVDNEMHGRMTYMARPDRISRRQDLNLILPGVQTIICVGLDYYTRQLPPEIISSPGRGRISNYAWGADYHDIMTPRLQALAAWLGQTTDAESRQRVYVDTGAILERDHAGAAGLGFTGKNSMLIHPRRGSYFFLGEILTTLPPPPAAATPQPATMPGCGTCHRCLTACPTNAFPEPYILDARRCISYLTIELKGWIPLALRPLLGNWIYGCDICQEVCPFNRFALATKEAAFQGSLDQMAPPLLELLSLDEAGFNQRYQNSPIKRIKRARFLRNVCVAAGNWGSETAVAPLTALLKDPEPLIRGHAAWALHQINNENARNALRQALQTETDDAVRRELANPD